MGFFNKKSRIGKRKKDVVDLTNSSKNPKFQKRQRENDQKIIRRPYSQGTDSGDYKDFTQSSQGSSEETSFSNSNSSSSVGGGGFFGSFFEGKGEKTTQQPQTSPETSVYGNTVNPEEKRRRLVKRLKDMTERMENLSNDIYHLQQRLELIERKLDIR